MSNSSTPANGGTTDSAVRDARIAGWAYNAGVERGRILGLIQAMTPDEKNRGEFRRREISERLREYANNHAVLQAERKHVRYWPSLMPGGWPLPPDVPSDDESAWWPEVDGWPCPPPALRGAA